MKPATIINKLDAYNKVLKNATPKGTATNPYNLANPSGDGARNFIEESANCYLISAPGHYCIPLVYGNSIKNNQRNIKAYQSSQPAGTPYLLKTFKEHRNIDIVYPWIGQQQGGGPDDAKIVWMDQPNLVRSSSLRIVHGPDYLEFEVKQEDIKNGNAVIAVTRGTEVVWSWHLWFDHADALDKIPVKNHDGVEYKFTRNTLGQVHIKYESTSYDKPRKARLTIEQQAGNGGIKASSPVVITQNPYSSKQDAVTFYQFGRKDAFPSTNTFYDGNSSTTPSTTAFTAIADASPQSIGTTIQNPDKFYGVNSFSYDVYNTTYCNTWSANNTKMNSTDSWNNDAVVKTIYDPCPAGFHIPAPKAFTGFSQDGQNGSSPNAPSDGWNQGWNFYTQPNPTSTTPTIFISASGYRYGNDGSLGSVGSNGSFWSALPYTNNYGCGMGFLQWGVYPQGYNGRSYGFPVRPVADN